MFKWIMLALVLLGTVGIIYFIQTQKNRPLPGQVIPISGRNHIPDGSKSTNFNSNPPTSGDHYQLPLDWGVYGDEQLDEKVVHNLEHGGVWLSYNCSVAEDNKTPQDFATQSAIPDTASGSAKLDDDKCKKLITDLEGIAKGYKSKVIMTPRSKNDSRVAVVSWGRIWKFNRLDRDRVIEFINLNRNNGPEFVPDM